MTGHRGASSIPDGVHDSDPLLGKAALQRLAIEVEREDPAASSHWREQHAAFRFTGAGFDGLRGFGGAAPARRDRQWAHYLLQRPFRSSAAGFASFAEFDALAKRICHAHQRVYDLDALRQAITLAFLQPLLGERLHRSAVSTVIGDGFGMLTALLLASQSAGLVVVVNLTRTLMVDLWYLRLWLGDQAFGQGVALVSSHGGLDRVLEARASGAGPRVIALRAVDHELLRRVPLDTAFNIVSMGEMDPPATAAYFSNLRAASALVPGRTAFYCCNREEKVLPDGTLTRFSEYPWHPQDEFQVDEPCPWHQRYYSLRPPFYFPYDGPIRHRLAVLAPESHRS